MKREIEQFKLEFIKGLSDSDYKFLHDYDNVQTCIEIICIRDLLSRKSKFKLFKLMGTERILIQMDKRFLIDYSIRQNGNRFELYEMTLTKYNEYEREYLKKGFLD